MQSIVIDFESASEVDIRKEGSYKYTHHESTVPLLMSYKIEDSPTELWEIGQEVPYWAKYAPEFYVYAFNLSSFEFWLWNQRFSPLYNLPQLQLEHCEDIAAICARCTLPIKLDMVTPVLGVGSKSKGGLALINRFCKPSGEGYKKWNDSDEKWIQFKEYCIQDTEVEYEVLKALPMDRLEPRERRVWMDSMRTNMRGVPVDYEAAKVIHKVATEYRETVVNPQLPVLTNGKITSVNQVQRIMKFCEDNGFSLPLMEDKHGVKRPTTRVDFLEAVLETDPNVPEKVRKVLEIRMENAVSAAAKYEPLIYQHHEGRIFDNQIYYGAHTGRFTGTGFQMFNLPRASVEHPETYIELFKKGWGAFTEGHLSPLKAAKALVRPMLRASTGKTLMVSDWSSIEHVVLHWVSGGVSQLNSFANGICPYKRLATKIFDLPYDEITKVLRGHGKVGDLGCGYCLGYKGLRKYARQFKIELTEAEAMAIVDTYREDNPHIKRLWNDLNMACLQAINSPGKFFEMYSPQTDVRVKFVVREDKTGRPWLLMVLPSGRSMMYMQPGIMKNEYGFFVPTFYGRDPGTKQWQKQELRTSKLVENVVQAVARDILVDAISRLEVRGYPVIASIYDEIICEIPEEWGNDEKMEEFNSILCEQPEWAKTFIPLKAGGYYAKRYRKD